MTLTTPHIKPSQRRDRITSVLDTLWDRMIAAVKAAALGTGTTLENEVIQGYHSVLPNEVLARWALRPRVRDDR